MDDHQFSYVTKIEKEGNPTKKKKPRPNVSESWDQCFFLWQISTRGFTQIPPNFFLIFKGENK
jgi:hypothetical protein